MERTLGVDEMIVTKTDLRGVITYANDVFLRLSALDEESVIGQPHNLIRHPDMPRCVFKLLWDTVQAGNELFAYVVNLAADGAHYWVLAHVTPSRDASGRLVGYHSNRRLPSRSAVTEISDIYRRLRALELARSRPADGIAASERLLADMLAASGRTYEQLVWSLMRESETCQ